MGYLPRGSGFGRLVVLCATFCMASSALTAGADAPPSSDRPAESRAGESGSLPVALRSLRDIADASGPIGDGSEFIVGRWDRFPSVLILDLRDFAAQDRMFSRLAFYLEKSGYRGRLMTDGELEGLHGWNAHDYGPAGLAAFFTAASAKNFPLTDEELRLRDLVLEEGIIERRGDSFSAGAGAVLSICRESDRYARRLLLAHESYHGIFFTVPAYRRLCYSLWDAAEKNERRFMLRLLTYLGYDTGSRELVVNEFQAYLLQQPASMLEAYVRRMEPLMVKNPNVSTPPVEDALPGLIADEKKLESFLEKNFEIGAGGMYRSGR